MSWHRNAAATWCFSAIYFLSRDFLKAAQLGVHCGQKESLNGKPVRAVIEYRVLPTKKQSEVIETLPEVEVLKFFYLSQVVMVLTFNPSPQEAEAGGSLSLQTELQDNQGYKEKPHLEKEFRLNQCASACLRFFFPSKHIIRWG